MLRHVPNFLIVCLALTVSGVLFLWLNAGYVDDTSSSLRAWANDPSNFIKLSLAPQLPQLESEAVDRVGIYEKTISQSFLLDGMVVNHDESGPIDVCDSLLFSSLRYISLVKLGLHDEALAAWTAIEGSEDPKTPGRWFRHPRCKTSPISRDMVVGLLAALALEETPHRNQHIMDFVGYVADNFGFAGNAHSPVSFLSSGLVELLRLEALSTGAKGADLPFFLGLGISSSELDVFFLDRGYTSHLFAMVLWTERELAAKASSPPFKARTVATTLSHYLAALGLERLGDLRQEWLAQRLYVTDKGNLFLKALMLRNVGAFTPDVRRLLLSDLLAMPEFPVQHTPTSCQRDSDYLWQRDSRYYRAVDHGRCSTSYSGVDFLWMAALLTTDQ